MRLRKSIRTLGDFHRKPVKATQSGDLARAGAPADAARRVPRPAAAALAVLSLVGLPADSSDRTRISLASVDFSME